MAQTLFYLIVAFVIFNFLVEQILDYLNLTRLSDRLPDELKGIYDENQYARSQQYLRANIRFSRLTETLSFLLVLFMLFSGGFAWLDRWTASFTQNQILHALMFFGILLLVSDLIFTPFSIYHTFVIEEKFGFNKTTPRTFILDKIKGWLLTAILGGGLLSIIIWIYQSTGEWFWLIAWGTITVFSLFMTMFYSQLIVPLFNKQQPLPDGDLRKTIEDFARKVSFRVKDIFLIDGSKRSTKANAYFTGIGSKKRIVLYDTLLENHPDDELVAILAHEIGHYRKKHILKGTILSILYTGILLFILSRFLGNPVLSKALGAEEGSFHMGLLAFGLLYQPVSLILGVVMNFISRKHEYEADRFAAQHFSAQSLKNALIRLSVKNLSNLRPHPVVVFLTYSHPPLLKRLEALDKL